MSQHWLPAKETGLSLMVGYDRPLDEYFAQLHDAAGDVVAEMLGTTDLAEVRKWIAPYLDTTTVGLHDVSTAIFMERYHGDDQAARRVVDWRSSPVATDAPDLERLEALIRTTKFDFGVDDSPGNYSPSLSSEARNVLSLIEQAAGVDPLGVAAMITRYAMHHPKDNVVPEQLFAAMPADVQRAVIEDDQRDPILRREEREVRDPYNDQEMLRASGMDEDLHAMFVRFSRTGFAVGHSGVRRVVSVAEDALYLLPSSQARDYDDDYQVNEDERQAAIAHVDVLEAVGLQAFAVKKGQSLSDARAQAAARVGEIERERRHAALLRQDPDLEESLSLSHEATDAPPRHYSYGPPHLNLTTESAERAYELQQALDWRRSIEFYEDEAKELHGRAAAEHLRQAAELRALVERIEARPRNLSIDAPALASEVREPISTVDPDLETSPAALRKRADAFEARAKMWRERPDRTAQDRRIAYGLERAAAALRDLPQVTLPNDPILTREERQSVRDFVRERNASSEWQLAGLLAADAPEPVRTAALAANAAEIGRHTTGLQPQQRDRQVVAITADATGRDRDRHGRRFQLDSSEDWTVEKRPGFTFTGPDGQQARADLTIIGRAGTVPVVVATAGHAEQLAAVLLTHVFADRAQAAEPFLLVEHRPDQQRFEHVDLADYRVRNEDRAPRIGDVIARREVVEPGQDLEEKQEHTLEPDLAPEPTQTRARGLRR